MIIRKIFFYLIISISILMIAGPVAAVTLENPLAGGGVNDFPQLLTRIAQKVGELIAVLGTIMIIVAGILYLTSAGSPDRIKQAKTALVYAIVGIAIGIAATTISSIILNIIGAES